MKDRIPIQTREAAWTQGIRSSGETSPKVMACAGNQKDSPDVAALEDYLKQHSRKRAATARARERHDTQVCQHEVDDAGEDDNLVVDESTDAAMEQLLADGAMFTDSDGDVGSDDDAVQTPTRRRAGASNHCCKPAHVL